MKFIQNIYSEHLKIINGIKFTHREIDLISFFVCGRAAKRIASFFSISPKTVENHTHNIMVKLGCNSRESIINFIEKSGKLPILRKYYASMLAQAAFEKCLYEVAKLQREEVKSCILTYWEDQNVSSNLAYYLEIFLKIAGVNLLIEVRNSSQSFWEKYRDNYVIYIVPENWKEHNISEKEVPLFLSSKSCILLFLPGKKQPIELLKGYKELATLDHKTYRCYYSLILEILKNLYPKYNFEKIISALNEQSNDIDYDIKDKQFFFSLAGEDKIGKKENSFNKTVRFNFQSIKWSLALIPILIFLFTLGYLKLPTQEGEEKNITLIQAKSYDKNQVNTIRSELAIPTQSILLNRPELISQIDDRLKDWKGIHTIALAGIGGAGKTTLARLYASSKDVSCLWEINAQTKESLNESFKELAQALSKTQEDQKILAGIMKIEASVEREEKVVQFVKERLRLYPSWVLIYDNVEKFVDIQNYFPKDPSGWGQGRVILTTQDSNIENNKYVNNVIKVGELNPEQKLNLFIKIMSNGGYLPFTASQKEEAKRFLSEIPPFPLDVSVAAYYLKATNITYNSYLENMHKYNNDFSDIQKKILQESGDYIKTRYNIITLSIKKILDSSSNFKDILLLVSMLDSQNIPRDILIKCKTGIIVDDFIYHLKKYSLITNVTPASHDSDAAFSIHRSTQAIVLAYLTKILGMEYNKNLVQPVANILENYLSNAIEKEDFSKMSSLYRHAEHFLGHYNLLNGKVEGSLSGELGCIYYYLCYYSKAERLLKLSLSKLDKYTDYNKIAHFQVYLGNVHRRLGNYEQAKELFEQSLEIYSKYSAYHTGMARAYGYLGVVYESLGDFAAAKFFLEKSLTIHKTDTQNPIGLAWSLAHLGSVYKNLGNYEKAKELYEQSYTIYKSYSENHVGAAWVSLGLGSIYTKLGDTQKAKNFLEESLMIYRKHFFENHIYIANALVRLGIFFIATKKYEEAKSLLKKGLVIIEATYGKDHSETAHVLKNLGKAYLEEGNLQAAEIALHKTLTIFYKNKHPNKYEALEILGDIYKEKLLKALKVKVTQQADYLKAQADSYFKLALAAIKNHFPEDSPHISRLQSKINYLTSL